MIRRPPRSTRTDTLFPYTTLFRSGWRGMSAAPAPFPKPAAADVVLCRFPTDLVYPARSEEHTSELQSLMRISYAVFCLKKKKTKKQISHIPYSRARTITLHAPYHVLYYYNTTSVPIPQIKHT